MLLFVILVSVDAIACVPVDCLLFWCLLMLLFVFLVCLLMLLFVILVSVDAIVCYSGVC